MNDALKNIDTYIKFYEAIQSIQSDIKKLEDDRINLDSRIIAIKIDNLKKSISNIRRSIYKNKELEYDINQCKKHLNQILIIYGLTKRLCKKEYFSYLIEREISIIPKPIIYDEELVKFIEDSNSNYKEIKKKILYIQKDISFKSSQDKLDCLVRNLNEISKLEEVLNGKSTLEKVYFYTAIFLAFLPILSGIGFLFLIIYLSRLNSSIFFTDILANGGVSGILFSAAIVFFFGLTQFLIPVCIIFSQKDKSGIFEKTLTLLMVVFSLFMSWIGFWSISTVLGAFIPAIFWTFLVLGAKSLYKLEGIRRGKPHAVILTILIMPFLFIFSISISSSILQFFQLSSGLRLENIFRTIDFVQTDYSWFKVNKPYFERTGLKPSELKIKEKKFSNEYSKPALSHGKDDVFLYGKLWVNANNLKILCPPSKIELKEKEEGRKAYTPMDIKPEEVDKECLVFRSDDLQRMMGFIEQPR